MEMAPWKVQETHGAKINSCFRDRPLHVHRTHIDAKSSFLAIVDWSTQSFVILELVQFCAETDLLSQLVISITSFSLGDLAKYSTEFGASTDTIHIFGRRRRVVHQLFLISDSWQKLHTDSFLKSKQMDQSQLSCEPRTIIPEFHFKREVGGSIPSTVDPFFFY